MMIRREETIKKLSERFSLFSNVVTIQNKSNYTDINKSSERLFIDILNIIYDINLRDMNEIQDNYPAIDLGDYKSRICIQVTSEASSGKFRKTLNTFKKKQLDRDFDEIWFLIISNKNKCSVTDESIETTVINLLDISHAVTKLSDRDLSYLDEYLERNLISRIESNDSILPSKILDTYSHVRSGKIADYLELNGDEVYIEQLENDLKNFSQTLSALNRHQREFIYYIVNTGQLSGGWSGHESAVVIPSAEIYQTFGEQGNQLFDSLIGKDIARINDEYEPHNDGRYITAVELYFRGELDDTNLFSVIKSYCGENNISLQQVLLNCNFSALD